MTAPSVVDLLAQLHAERVATWDPVDLRANIDQRGLLERTADRTRFVQAGDTVAPFRLPEVGGTDVDLNDLLARGPVVLIFFRFAGCPACNIALPHYQRELYPRLVELGASLVAISPQLPEKLREIKQRHQLSFLVASDPNYEVLRPLGITFTPDERSEAHARSKGNDLGVTLGTGQWELPMPTVVVVDTSGHVAYADVHPDWLIRTEAGAILEAVHAVVASVA